MPIQRSDCCKAEINFNPQLPRPECYSCMKCGRIIGSLLPNPQIDMETPKIKSVEELKKEWIDAWEYHEDKPEHQANWWINKITQDRASLHTSLVAAVEEMQQILLDEDDSIAYRRSEGVAMALTIINSIFKE